MAGSANGVVLEENKGLPSWLKPSVFLQADFQADEYVSYLRRFVSALSLHCVLTAPARLLALMTSSLDTGQVPLETLSSELQRYITVLKGKLVEVINEDYNDFVSLSTKLVNVDGAVTQMQKPLLMLKVPVLDSWKIQVQEIDKYMLAQFQRTHAGSIASCAKSCPSRALCAQPGFAEEAASCKSQSSA